jgi:hypothetical protein
VEDAAHWTRLLDEVRSDPTGGAAGTCSVAATFGDPLC